MFVLVNGSPMEEFTMERGLRQGDPLSPFLFNIIVESLSCCLKKALDLNMIKGAMLGNGELHISYLQFADDTILFLEPKMSGEKVVVEEDWAASLRCRKSNFPITYLGLPLGSRPSSKAFCDSVLLRIQKRLAPWKKKFLSKGGRLILIKSVLASIPTYYLSIFKVPVSVAQDIEKLQTIFFWGDGIEK
ncbi:hypothetical protein Dsin_020818 [Dipteronia sinensis]|uniref:Reverse transcriptase domain-containing protein n=1 Tax=Dipteronia sinensis TaxID=43782 RepID=A0AAE0E3V7_9ROSI|nr:hypothetical protein Dsin_020818 [Dipteronia sinensis]